MIAVCAHEHDDIILLQACVPFAGGHANRPVLDHVFSCVPHGIKAKLMHVTFAGGARQGSPAGLQDLSGHTPEVLWGQGLWLHKGE